MSVALQPAVRRDLAAAHVDADEHALGAVRGERLAQQLRVGERGGAEDHARGARVERLGDRLRRAQPAAVLHRHARSRGDRAAAARG